MELKKYLDLLREDYDESQDEDEDDDDNLEWLYEDDDEDEDEDEEHVEDKKKEVVPIDNSKINQIVSTVKDILHKKLASDEITVGVLYDDGIQIEIIPKHLDLQSFIERVNVLVDLEHNQLNGFEGHVEYDYGVIFVKYFQPE